ncbi:MAG: Tat pathway signal protein [Atopobiaceae bacterium]|nr:Tat pathway signal protein [Atopobiaceae bacterium]
MSGRHPDKGRARILPARTVTRRDALRLLIGAGAAIAASPLRAFADPDDVQAAIDEGYEATDETNAALAEAQERFEEVAAELERIGQEYADLAAQHSRTLDEIERVTKEIADLEKEIERKQAEIERTQARLGARMSSAYKSGNSGVLDLLFSATTFDELTSNIYYLDKISESDRQMVQTIKDTKAALEDDKRRLEEQRKQLEELKQQEEEELKRIQEKQAEVQELLNHIDAEVAELLEKRDSEILAAKEAAEEAERQRQASMAAGGVYGEVDYGYASTGSQSAVVDAAAWTPSTGVGYCAAWVSNVFANAGVGLIYGNACDMYWAYCYSSDLSEIQPGMIIAVPTEPYSYAAILYGHIGIYIGGGIVRHCSSGWVMSQSLDSWISEFGVTSTPRWGWLGGIVLG